MWTMCVTLVLALGSPYGCLWSADDADDGVAWVTDHAKTYRILYFAVDHGEKNPKSDIPRLKIGDLTCEVIYRGADLLPFDKARLTDAVRSKKNHSLSCLCLPEYVIGLSLCDEKGQNHGWALFSKNHNSIAFVDNDGKLVRDYRFQLFTGDGLFKKAEATLDLDQLVGSYGAKFPE